MGKRLWDLAKSRFEIATILLGHRYIVYESYTRGRTCPPSTAESRSFYLCSARALGHWASGRRPAGEEDG